MLMGKILMTQAPPDRGVTQSIVPPLRELAKCAEAELQLTEGRLPESLGCHNALRIVYAVGP